MPTKSDLVELEEAFWRSAGDRERYAARLAGDGVHVFPGWGVADRDLILDGVAEARPWRAFALEKQRVLELGEDAAALVYEARASRAGENDYSAAVTSVYRRRDDAWELVVHQQTPLG